MLINIWNENSYTIQQANYNPAILLQTWIEQTELPHPPTQNP